MATNPYSGLNPVFASRLQAMIAAAKAEGHTIGLGSTVRSPEEQAKLRIKNGCPDVYRSPASSCRIPTAIPGRSNHQDHGHGGMAVDLTGDTAWANRNAARFGLHFPIKGEAWHVEPIHDGETSEAFRGNMSRGGYGTDMSWMDDNRSPEDELHARLGQIRSALGFVPADSAAGSRIGQTADKAPAQTQSAAMTTGRPLEDGGLGDIPPPGYVPPGKGAERWRSVVAAALRYVGEPTDPRSVDMVIRRIAKESGGNPNAVNLWDSNAKRGDPTTGLMQNIPSAFTQRAQELAGRGITDGFANIVAALRYTKKRYGSLSKGLARPGGY